MHRWIAAGFFSLFGGGIAYADLQTQIVDFGISRGESGPPETERGDKGLSPARPITRLRYIERTDRIEARRCRSFGMTVQLTAEGGTPLPRRLRVRVLHPPFTRPDGATSSEDVFASDVVRGRSNVGFTFDHTWEMQPGTWTMIVEAGTRELARKEFSVTAPTSDAAAPECGPR